MKRRSVRTKGVTSVSEGLSVPFIVPVVKSLLPRTIMMNHSSYSRECHASCTLNSPKSNTMCATCGAGTAYLYGAPEFTPVYIGVRSTRSLVFCVMFWRSLFVPFLGHCVVCPSIYGFWLPPLVSSKFSCSFRKWIGAHDKATCCRQHPTILNLSVEAKRCCPHS